MKSMNPNVKRFIRQVIIAACYFIFTFITHQISFSSPQFRLAEMLVLLCFFKKDYIFGVTVGCVLANLTSSVGMVDAAIGGATTLLTCLFVYFCPRLLPGLFMTCLANGFVVGLELYCFKQQDFWLSVLFVALGELAVLTLAYIILQILRATKKLPPAEKLYGQVDFTW